MNKPISDQQLDAQLANVSKDVKPQRDLWQGIERAIEHREQSDHQQESIAKPAANQGAKPLLLVASVALVALTTWFMNIPQQNNPGTAPVVIAELNGVEALEQDYQSQKNAMLVSFGQPDLKRLPKDIQNQFAELSAARVSLLQALEADPDNVNLLNLLRWTHKQELQLLEQLYSPQWLSI